MSESSFGHADSDPKSSGPAGSGHSGNESPGNEVSGIPTEANPYVRAQLADDVAVVRPTGITVVAVVCLVAGILGGLSSLGSLANTLFAERFASMFTPPGAAGEIQAEMQREMMAVLGKYYFVNLAMSVAGIAIGVALFVGGIGAIQGKLWSRFLIRRTLLVAIFFEVVRVVVYSLTQFEMFPVTQEYMQKIAGQQNGAMGGDTMAWFSTIGVVISMLFVVGWFLLKLFLMIWGRRYLAKPMLDSYFGTPASSPS
ncbi:membrane protein [Rhodopirellula maiorica SM1]|uniref:Membrane protein n=1 Tax=Rhodopirellula maiorica SM1 TaxID=1265738 RepID=M5RCE1_9BACT|nr:hypothetical protein [Rhodopirellula maiorica]EMI17153.1 membrane protein [Rhodopirellula maiorica SM1]